MSLRFPILLAVVVTILGACSLSAEQRFPPPQFESGHQLPVLQAPGPRSLIWQFADVVVLAAGLAVSSWLIHKKRSRAGVISLSIFSLLYFGFWKKGCVCSIGSLQNVSMALLDPAYALPLGVLAFFALPIVFALFFGRSFCASLCPHGALQDLVLLKPLKLPAWLEHGLGMLPFIYLGAAVLFAATGSAFIICQYDPFVPIFRMNGRTLMVLSGAALLLLGIFVGRPYCRFLCPFGALLKLSAIVSRFRVRVTPTSCTQCRLCEGSCPFGVIREPELPKLEPARLKNDRRFLAWLVVLVPLLILAAGLLGWRFSGVAARLHPTVKLAELFVREGKSPVKTGVLAPEDFALEKARVAPAELMKDAATVQRRFAIGTTLFGAWVGLVFSAKLISLSVYRRRTDFEPDSGGCFGCARCFESCPNERVRRGWETQAPARAPTAALIPETKS